MGNVRCKSEQRRKITVLVWPTMQRLLNRHNLSYRE